MQAAWLAAGGCPLDQSDPELQLPPSRLRHESAQAWRGPAAAASECRIVVLAALAADPIATGPASNSAAVPSARARGRSMSHSFRFLRVRARYL
jgi:hypothetical protein